METYFHEKDDQFHSGSDERIRLTSDRCESSCIRIHNTILFTEQHLMHGGNIKIDRHCFLRAGVIKLDPGRPVSCKV